MHKEDLGYCQEEGLRPTPNPVYTLYGKWHGYVYFGIDGEAIEKGSECSVLHDMGGATIRELSLSNLGCLIRQVKTYGIAEGGYLLSTCIKSTEL